jgi:aspartate/methionine/tyrosine aminotransferase
MPLPIFQLEEFLGEWEFKAPYMFCGSDAESWSMSEILSLSDQEGLKLWNELRLGYTEVPGLPALREEIALLYDRCSAKNILCLAGAEEGIFCTAKALLTGKDHAIVIKPCYQSLEALARDNAGQITVIELAEEDGWELDLTKVKAAIRANTKMLFINYPHNPTGARLTDSKLTELVEILRHHQIILFSDEVYRMLGSGGANDCEPGIASIYELGISLGVMSKAFGLAGLRVGWLAAQDVQLLKKIEQIKHYTSICNSAPSEILSLIALRAKDKILQRNNVIVAANLELIDAFIARHDTLFSWVKPKGGCVGFVRYLGADGVDHFCAQLLDDKGVLVLPGRVYDWHQSNFRVGFGRKNMPDSLSRMEAFVSGE